MAGDDRGWGEGGRDGLLSFRYTEGTILGDPGAVSWDDRMFVAKVYCKLETSPWALTLTGPVPEAFEFPAFDCLHDVVFLINRHNCVARSTGTVLEQNVNNLVTLQALAWLQETNTLRWIFRPIIQRYCKFLLLIRYAMHDFHFPHLCSSIQSRAYILDVHVLCTTSETFYSVKISHGPHNYQVDRSWEMLASCSARTVLLAFALNSFLNF